MIALAVRWLASIIVALCLVGAGAVRAQRHVTGDPYERAELSAATHVVAKLAPRRHSGLPDQRLGAFVVVDRTLALWARPPYVLEPARARPSPPPAPPELHVRSARGPPDRG